jgi:serine/threonine protein phosphatase PrpC
MRTGLLLGRNHSLLGSIATIAEGRAAIAISRGGAPKTYAHKDPNEDAAAFAMSGAGTLLAVADGHAGHEASQAVIERLVEAHAPRWLDPERGDLSSRWPDEVHAMRLDANAAILENIGRDAVETSRTTLTLAVVRPDDDLLAYACMGDSLLFGVHHDRVEALGTPGPGDRTFFLGYAGEDRDSLYGKYRADTIALGTACAVVLATDGLSEEGIGVDDPAGAVGERVSRAESAPSDVRALEAARGLAACAVDSHRTRRSGDNVATAVVWLG